MQTGVLRVLRATAASWWRHKELRRTDQPELARQLERKAVLRDLGYLRQAATLPNAHVICGVERRPPWPVPTTTLAVGLDGRRARPSGGQPYRPD